jgi:hypothetical protein
VRIVGARTFVLSEGVWIDTAFDPQAMQTIPVSFLSEDYFALVASQPELADAFALGERVIALSDGVAYEVVAVDAVVQPIEIPPTTAPDESSEPPATQSSDTEPDENTPSVPGTGETPDGSQAEPSTGPCAGGLLPLLLLPVLAVLAKKRERS